MTKDEEAGSGATQKGRLRERGNPDGVRPIPRGKGRERSSLSHPSPQAGALAAQAWGASQGSRHRPGQAQVGPEGPAGGTWGSPRAPPGPCSGMWSRRGHAGRGRAARTRGGAGPRRGQEVGAPGFRGSGSPTGSQPPAERPLQRGPRQYSGAVPLPSPGSAALPAPKTPSF